MAHAIESMFVVTEKDEKGEETEPYLTPDLDKIQKAYAPKVMPGHFEDAVLAVPEWTFGWCRCAGRPRRIARRGCSHCVLADELFQLHRFDSERLSEEPGRGRELGCDLGDHR